MQLKFDKRQQLGFNSARRLFVGSGQTRERTAVVVPSVTLNEGRLRLELLLGDSNCFRNRWPQLTHRWWSDLLERKTYPEEFANVNAGRHVDPIQQPVGLIRVSSHSHLSPFSTLVIKCCDIDPPNDRQALTFPLVFIRNLTRVTENSY